MSLKVSVVIPAYNRSGMVRAAIESVLRQTLPADEIIVVDDGSTDDTPGMLRSYGGRIRVITQKNQGQSKARNVGIAAATADWIALLDSDNIWFPDKQEKQVAFLERNPGLGMVAADYLWVGRLGPRPDKSTLYAKNFDFEIPVNVPLGPSAYRMLLRTNFVGECSAVIIRKDVIQRAGGFDETIKLCEDYDCWFRCVRETDMAIMSDKVFERRVIGGNLSDDEVALIDYYVRMLKRQEAYCLARPDLAPVYRRGLSESCYRLGNLFYNAGRIRKAFAAYFEGLRAEPTARNRFLFAKVLARKAIRTASFGLITRYHWSRQKEWRQ